MPRNGSGQFNLANGPFVPSTVISSTTMNSNFSDIGTALTQSIANDGQTTPVANLPMATFRHTNVGNAVARNEYAAYGQVQDGQPQWLTSIAGTNTITASIAPGPTSYTAGQSFRFIAAGANTSSAVTLNINGLGAKNITKQGTLLLVPGDIPSGAVVSVTYDGTQFQLQSAAAVASGGVVGQVRNAVASVTTASAALTLTADEIIVETVLGGTQYKLTSFSQTCTLTTTGANGMDTGAAPNNGFVALYALYNPTTGAAGLMAVNATSAAQPSIYGGANMPSGFTASGLVSVWNLNGSAQFIIGIQQDRKIWINSVNQVSTSSSSTTNALITIGAPKNSKTADFNVTFSCTSATNANIAMGSTSTGTTPTYSFPVTSGSSGSMAITLPLITQQSVWYTISNSAGTPTTIIALTGYSF